MKKKLKQATSLTLASAITLASCSPNGTNLLNTNDVQETKKTIDTNELLEECVIQLTQEDQQLMNYCIGLIDELMTDSSKAKAFISAPNAFLEQYGSEYEGELDEGLIEMLKVLAHDDIKESIENKDFKRFTDLCGKYDVFSIPRTVRDTLELITDKKSIKKIASNFATNFKVIDNSMSIKSIVFINAIIAITLVVVYVAVYDTVVVTEDVEVDGGDDNIKYISNKKLKIQSQMSRNHIVPSALTFYRLNTTEKMDTLYINKWVEEQYKLINDFLIENDELYAINQEYRNSIQQIIKGMLLKEIL